MVSWAFHTYLAQKHTTSLPVPDKTPDFPTYHAHPPITQCCSVSCHAVIEQMVQHLTTILKIYKGAFRTNTQPSVVFRRDLLNICLSYFYFVLRTTKAQLQLIYKLSRSYMFRHYRVILRELVISTSPSYTSISNAAVGNTI